MKTPLVYIIILHLNELTTTTECINSLSKITYRNYKIVVVDNGPTNDSADCIEDKFKDVTVLKTYNNLGFSGGCNIGIRFALKNNAEYVLLLNNDTVVDKHFLKELVQSAIKNQKVGIVSPKIYYFDNSNVIWSTGAYKNNKAKFGYIDYEYQKKDLGQYSEIKVVDCVWGCCILIKRDIFKRVGFFDEDYFLYAEDIDFCYRVQKAGYSILFNPRAKIWHKVSGSSGGEGNITKDYYNTRNLILFAKKNLSGNEKFNYFFYILLDRTITIISLIKNKKYQNILANIKGLYHGYSGKGGYYKIQK